VLQKQIDLELELFASESKNANISGTGAPSDVVVGKVNQCNFNFAKVMLDDLDSVFFLLIVSDKYNKCNLEMLGFGVVVIKSASG